MAIERPVLTLAMKAGENLSSYQYRFVTQLGADNDTVVLMNAGTDIPMGILQNAPVAGEAAEVMVLGVSKLVANDAIAVGTWVKAEYLSATDNGKADAADTDKDNVCGLVVFASGAEDDLCSVLLGGPFSLSHT
jgi:hypothetical protein